MIGSRNLIRELDTIMPCLTFFIYRPERGLVHDVFQHIATGTRIKAGIDAVFFARQAVPDRLPTASEEDEKVSPRWAKFYAFDRDRLDRRLPL
jgi:hypothetical protein